MHRVREEEGAVAVIVALIICFLLVPLAAIAVDLGMQRVARRDMQSLADVVALDLSRDVDGTRSAPDVLAAWSCSPAAGDTCDASSNSGNNKVGRSVVRNGSTMGDAPAVRARLGCIDQLGEIVWPGEQYQADSSATLVTCTRPDGVKVYSTTAVDFNLAAGKGGAERTAVGKTRKTACFHLGSFAARFKTNDSVLLQKNGGALNDLLSLDLGVADYQGLSTAAVTLADLAATNQIGGVEQLLGGSVSTNPTVSPSPAPGDPVTLGELFSATYTVLNAQNDPKNSVALALLNNPAAWFGGDLGAEVDLAGILGVSTNDHAALMTDISVLDLVAGAIAIHQDRDGDGVPDNFLSLSNLNLATLSDPTKSFVNLIQGKQLICGKPLEAAGDSSQLDVHIEKQGIGNLGLTGIGTLSTATLGYSLDADLGKAHGVLQAPVVCNAGTPTSPDTYSVSVTSSLASASLNAQVRLVGSTTSSSSVVVVPLVQDLLQALFGLLTTGIAKVEYDVTVTFAASTTTPPPSGTVALQVPQNAANVPNKLLYPATETYPAGVPKTLATSTPLQLPTIPTATITGTMTVTPILLSLLPGTPRTLTVDAASLQPLLTSVTSMVNNNSALDLARDAVNTALADLGAQLGLSLGGADVYSHYRPECRGAELIG